MKQRGFCAWAAAAVAAAASAFAGDGAFRLGASDGYGESSYDAKGHWVGADDGAAATSAPTAGCTNLVASRLHPAAVRTGRLGGD